MPDDAPARLDVRALERALRARLLATEQFAAGAATPDAGLRTATRAFIQVGIDGAEVEDKGMARARVRIRLETRPADAPGGIAESLEGAGEQPYAVPRAGPKLIRQGGQGKRDPDASGAKDALFERLVLRIAGDLIDDFGARRRLGQASPEQLHAALQGDGGTLRLEAIRVIGARKVVAESATLLALLDDPDETTRDAALGALISLRDRRAVTELARTRSLRDRREMHKIIEAIAILGGQEADDYLSFVASSHDDDEIRAEAAAARARLQRRQADGAANGP